MFAALAALLGSASGTPPSLVVGFANTAVNFAPLGPYLTAALASTPANASIAVTYMDMATVNQLVMVGGVDFVLLDPYTFACATLALEAAGEPMAPLATAATLQPSPTVFGGLLPQEDLAGTFVVLASSPLHNVSDLAGARVAGTLDTVGGGLAQVAELEESYNLSAWTFFSGVFVAQSSASVLASLVSGGADVGMVRSGVFETSQAPLCSLGSAGCYPAGTFRVVGEKTGTLSLDGGLYPYQTSTSIFPESVFAALPHVSAATRKAVTDALFALTSSAPAAQAAGLSTFNPPLPYQISQMAVAALGMVQPDGLCAVVESSMQVLGMPIVCPVGSYLLVEDDLAASCGAAGISCPAGDACACHACAPIPVERMLVQVAPVDDPGNLTTCEPLAICNVLDSNTSAGIATLTDQWFGAAAESLGQPVTQNVSFQIHNYGVGYRYTSTENIAAIDTWYPSPPGALNGTWTLRLPVLPLYGDYYLIVQVNGIELPVEYIVQVKPVVCLGVAQAHNGLCTCPGAYRTLVTADGAVTCEIIPLPSELNQQQIGGIVGGCVAFVLLLVWAVYALTQRGADSGWTIDRDAIDFGDTPVVLGRGAYGQVLRASFKGTIVAVKRTRPIETQWRTRTSGLESLAFMGSMTTVLRTRTRSPRSSTDSLKVCGGRVSETGCLGELARWRRDAALRADFVKEMRLLVHLRHPNVVTVLGAVMSRSSVPLMLMELMERGSFYDLMHNETLEMDIFIVVPILRDVAAGVHFLHSSRPLIVHNDLKSSNVLIDGSFRAKISDFGLSGRIKRSGRGSVLGTPLYMAPELVRRDTHNSPATDIYSFGVMMNEAVTRRDPFEGEDPFRRAGRRRRPPSARRAPQTPRLRLLRPALRAEPDRGLLG